MNVLAKGVNELLRVADYRGRSTRTDLGALWLVTTLTGGFLVATSIILERVGFYDPRLSEVVPLICQLLFIIPAFALFTRRLHDAGWSGWWVTLSVPAIIRNVAAHYYWLKGDFESRLAVLHWPPLSVAACALLAVFILLFLPGEGGSNRYGPNPRYGAPGEAA